MTFNPNLMNIYFVRHGESQNNAQNLFQDHTPNLSENGRKQAEAVADRFTKIKIDKIISSHYVRAQETAEIIGKKINKDIEFSELFKERKRPSILINKSGKDPESLKIIKEIEENFHDKSYRHSDEENFSDLLQRAKLALEYLQNLKYDDVLVISHMTFIQLLVAYVIYDEELTSQLFLKFRKRTFIDNTGITVVNEWEDKFALLTFNDQAHLG